MAAKRKHQNNPGKAGEVFRIVGMLCVLQRDVSERDPEDKNHGIMEWFGLSSLQSAGTFSGWGEKKIQGIVGSLGMSSRNPGMFEFTPGQELKALSLFNLGKSLLSPKLGKKRHPKVL